MVNKKLITMITALSLCISVSGCSDKTNTSTTGSSDVKSKTTPNTVLSTSDEKVETIGDIETYIKLSDNKTTVDGDGVKIDGNTITINTAGTYSLSGKLSDGQIVVNTDKEEKTYILLDGVDITCSNSSAINVVSSEKVVFALADGSENKISDGNTYAEQGENETQLDAAIFSKEDIAFIGNGSLEVDGNYDKGIVSKDDLIIENGNITVKSVSDAIKGKDSVVIRGGNITVDAGGDGIQAYNDEDETKGVVSLEGGTIKITSEQDGVQAETNLLVAGGNIDITSGGGSTNSSSNDGWGQWGGGRPGEPGNQNESTQSTEDTVSAKAIKASSVIQIDDGKINIDSSDDAIHSNDKLIINDGTINISSGDDGIHSDSELEINGSTLNIEKSYEGIESTEISINNGNIHVVASDDGLNAAGGADGSSISGRPGQNGMESTTTGSATIKGGYLVIDSNGDGLDANGDLTMTEGTVIVNGPTNGGNGSLDYDGEFNITGGTLIAAGSLGMVQTPSSSSKLNSINISLTSQEANTLIRVESEDGDDVITFAPSKTYSSVIVCTPNIKSNETYKIYVGGSSTGDVTDGLYSGGTYTKGSEVGSYEISETVTNVTQEGASSGDNRNQPGGGGGGRDNRMTPPNQPSSSNQGTNNSSVESL